MLKEFEVDEGEIEGGERIVRVVKEFEGGEGGEAEIESGEDEIEGGEIEIEGGDGI